MNRGLHPSCAPRGLLLPRMHSTPAGELPGAPHYRLLCWSWPWGRTPARALCQLAPAPTPRSLGVVSNPQRHCEEMRRSPFPLPLSGSGIYSNVIECHQDLRGASQSLYLEKWEFDLVKSSLLDP